MLQLTVFIDHSYSSFLFAVLNFTSFVLFLNFSYIHPPSILFFILIFPYSYCIEDTRILHKDYEIFISAWCVCIKFSQCKAGTPLGFLFELFSCSSAPNYNCYFKLIHVLKCCFLWKHFFIVPVNQTLVLISSFVCILLQKFIFLTCTLCHMFEWLTRAINQRISYLLQKCTKTLPTID